MKSDFSYLVILATRSVPTVHPELVKQHTRGAQMAQPSLAYAAVRECQALRETWENEWIDK